MRFVCKSSWDSTLLPGQYLFMLMNSHTYSRRHTEWNWKSSIPRAGPQFWPMSSLFCSVSLVMSGLETGAERENPSPGWLLQHSRAKHSHTQVRWAKKPAWLLLTWLASSVSVLILSYNNSSLKKEPKSTLRKRCHVRNTNNAEPTKVIYPYVYNWKYFSSILF